MGHLGGSSAKVWDLYERIPALLTSGPSERIKLVEGGQFPTLRRLVSDAKLSTPTGIELQKPDFTYGDAIADQDEIMNHEGSV